MILMMTYVLVDKFGTIVFSLVIYSFVIMWSNETTLLDNLYPNYSEIERIFIALIIGLFAECIIAVIGQKNLIYSLRSYRYGYIKNSYYQSLDALQIAFSLSFSLPCMAITFANTIEKDFLSVMPAGIVLSACGFVPVSFIALEIKESVLYNTIHIPIRMLWKREFPKWIVCCAIEDIDNDGKNEYIVGCADNYLYCFRDGNEIWKKNIGNVASPQIGIGKIGNDDQIKIVIGTYGGEIICLDSCGNDLWKIKLGQWIWSVTIGDVNNDGVNEVIAGGMDDIIHVYKDGGEELWSESFDSWIGCCSVADVDGDGNNELVVGSNDTTFRCFKNGSYELWRATFGEWVTCCAVGDIDNDGLIEVVVGSSDGTLRCYKNGLELWRTTIIGGPGALAIGDVDNDGVNEIVAGCGDHTVRVYKGGKEVWIGRLDRYPDCIAIGDIDNDGKNEILTGDWYSYLICFKL